MNKNNKQMIEKATNLSKKNTYKIRIKMILDKNRWNKNNKSNMMKKNKKKQNKRNKNKNKIKENQNNKIIKKKE